MTVAARPEIRDETPGEPQIVSASARSRLLRRAEGFRLEFERRTAYDVIVSGGPVFRPAEPVLADVLEGRPVFAVVDRRVDAIYGKAFRAYAAGALRCAGILPMHAAEATKSLASVERICTAAHAAGLPRDGVFLAIGGGVTLDQVGLAAALYRRGVRFVRVPTTLVGIVDVGVGIKQAVNTEGGKSLLGAFHPAYANVVDATFLGSLPAAQIACGLAEIAKMALICDPTLFELLERDGASLLALRFQGHPSAAEVIARAQITMMDQLSDNLYEDDRARFVDLGHTFSPKLETHTGYAIEHGEAVALDMVLSAAIAAELRICDDALLPRLAALLRRVGLPVVHDALDRALALAALEAARVHRDGALNLVVPRAIGEVTFVQHVGDRELDAAIDRVRALRG